MEMQADGEEMTSSVIGLSATMNSVDPEELEEAYLANTFDPRDLKGAETEVRSDLTVLIGDPPNEHEELKLVGGIIDYRAEVSEGHWLVVDYKSGNPDYQSEAEHNLQLLSYGASTLLEKGVDKVTVQLYFPRLGDDGWTEPHTIDGDEAERIVSGILDLVTAADAEWGKPESKRRYSVGEECTFCPGAATCPARMVPVAGAYNAIREVPILKKDGKPGKRTKMEIDFTVTLDNAAQVIYAVRQAKKATGILSDRVKEFVREHGPVSDGRGRELAFSSQSRAAAISIEDVEAALVKSGIDEVGQIKVLYELRELPRSSFEKMDFRKERNDGENAER